MRLLLGALAGQNFSAELTGDASLRARPMGRVTGPLSQLGARFDGDSQTAPIHIRGGRLSNTTITSTVASAQVKTAVLLAGLQGEGTLSFSEPALSRDHTERMLDAMGVEFERTIDADGVHTIRLQGQQTPRAVDVEVPGDISSATFFLVAATIVEGSDITIEHVGVNPSRTGALDVLLRMGADITLQNEREVGGEPVADIRVRSSSLEPVRIHGPLIPRLVDEIPVLSVAMAHADGTSRIEDAGELRVKESDRIATTMGILNSLNVEAQEQSDGLTISGGSERSMTPPQIDAGLDHRIAMAALVAGLPLNGETSVGGADSINSSFPNFLDLVEQLRA